MWDGFAGGWDLEGCTIGHLQAEGLTVFVEGDGQLYIVNSKGAPSISGSKRPPFVRYR